MYAVIRSGGKQYRVKPGDVVQIEQVGGLTSDSKIETADIVAVSSEDGKLSPAGDARVSATVLGHGKADKVLVFHYKRKKQYKKLAGHRQRFTRIRIDSIHVGGKEYKAEKA